MDDNRFISIITAAHDQLAYNKVFFEALRKYTHHNFELIVVDNASTDASPEFFRESSATVLSQDKNYNYSRAMNIGSARAKGDYLCHINNDVIVGVDWDKHLIGAMEMHGLDFAWPASMEVMPTYTETRKMLKKWQKIGKPSGTASEEQIISAWRRMYKDWESYCREFARKNYGKLLDGINGHTLMISRKGWEAVGGYDDSAVFTDWDIYMRVKKLEVGGAGICAPKVVCWAYVHHFMGVTAATTRCAYDSDVALTENICDKWPIAELDKYFPFPMYVHPAPNAAKQPLAYLRYAFKRCFNLYRWGDRW